MRKCSLLSGLLSGVQMCGNFEQEALEEAGKTLLDLAAGFEDLLVAERFGAQACGEVGDAGDAENLNAHVAGDDGLRHRGHAHQGCTQSAEGADFSRGLEAGAADGDIDAFGDFETFGGSGFLGQDTEGFGIGLGHIEKAQAGAGAETEVGLVGAGEGIETHKIDVVGECDKLANVVVF